MNPRLLAFSRAMPKSILGLAWLSPWVMAVGAAGPFREVAKDDDWAYALTVQHLLEHHEYRLHDWATANLPAQIVWGALFSAGFGFSFATLRISTLVLLAIALTLLWRFLKDAGLSSSDAGILVCVIYSSPLVFMFSMSFMTDVPFMSWLVIALLAYMRALRLDSTRWMFAGSLFASAAILTRQFGVALPVALILLLLADRKRRSWLPWGVALPLVAVFWQVSNTFQPTAYLAINLERQALYLADPVRLTGDLFFRFARICQYVGLYAVPLAPLLVHVARRIHVPRLWALYMSLAALADFLLNGALMPSLVGNLSAVASRIPLMRLPLTLIATVAAILLGAILFRRIAGWKNETKGRQTLALVSGGLVVFHLAYVDLIDEYLIVFLPLVVIALAPEFGQAPRSVKRATAGLSVIALVASTAWTFVLLERKTAYWIAAETLHERGVPADQIYAGEWTYFRIGHGSHAPREYSPERIDRSTYLVWDPLFAPYRVDETWVEIARQPYRWIDLTERHVSLYRRSEALTSPGFGDGAKE